MRPGIHKTVRTALVLFLIASTGAPVCAWDHAFHGDGGILLVSAGVGMAGGTTMMGAMVLNKEYGVSKDELGIGLPATTLGGMLCLIIVVNSSTFKSVSNKELVHRFKVDHDVYLAGGERTPWLQGVYRELRRKHLFEGPETRAYSEGIDEEALTASLDRLVARMDTP